MRKILSIIAIALMGAFVLSSCEKKYETEPLKTVTISGSVKAWFDLSQNNLNDGFTNVPQGTRLIFRIEAEDLCHDGTIDNSYAYNTLQYETTVDNNGNYSMELPCVNFKTTAVRITPVDFKSKQKTKETNWDPNTMSNVTTIIEAENIFNGNVITVNIREGEVFYKNLYYTTTEDPGYYPF